MPLEILLVLVVGGIGGIALLLHLSGRSELLVMSREEARAAWLRHVPGDDILDVTVSHTGHAALVQTNEGPGLIWAFGADTVARHLVDFDLLDLEEGLAVVFHDYSAPRVHLQLTEAERQRWRELMRP
ncbi:MAG: hypothetical protein GJ676_20890 [Rhodobacteraceae bacterium]|nr:hypothetical protein [Paracoccaceae bacterium]